MLNRQKIILALLDYAKKPLSHTVFMKLMFLLSEETIIRNDRTFYDFVPYKYGPFSFALYRELNNLNKNSYLVNDDDKIMLSSKMAYHIQEKIEEISDNAKWAIAKIIDSYGKFNQNDLIRDVYSRYKWYATKSELNELLPDTLPTCSRSKTAVYTIGYESRSIDSFFNELLRKGVKAILDVRATPISRKYGFAKESLSRIANNLSLKYQHLPILGITSQQRTDLKDLGSYQSLFKRYEQELINNLKEEVVKVSEMVKRKPTALLCMEKDVRYCHRGRLAELVSEINGLPIVHL